MNTSPKAKRILCFGDSNVWGYIPNSAHERYPASQRWTGVLQNLLGEDFEIIEEGLNSRTINRSDPRPGKEGRNAMDYIIPCLDTHDPLDFIILLLGTNELKSEYNLTPEEIASDMKTLLDTIQNRRSQFRDIQPKVIVILSATIDETTEYSSKDDKYKGGTKKSELLKDALSHVAMDKGAEVLDIASGLETGADGIHLTPTSHKSIALALSQLINPDK